ncbi:M81 family metallopeptidase [Caballeronia mineralivorans]|uniref:M81 family metallopeptidase n=1 Tax=Caballeronia mineralivorans TaxID=2010198 RepID=UPI0009E48095|nr:M81 family metallopeptidase [Caballeronia mineralivorans]
MNTSTASSSESSGSTSADASTVSTGSSASPRIALLGFSIECNHFAPPAGRSQFRCLLADDAVVDDARSPTPVALGEMPGFVADMDAAGPWQPRPIYLAMAEPNGPVEHPFFEALCTTWRDGLRALRGHIDGVYCVMHGAGITTGDLDPEGTIQRMIRDELGADVPLVCSYDLHANVSDEMVACCDAFVGYRTNPHLDMRERGAESAQLLRRLLAGERTYLSSRRLPIIGPSVTLLSARGPYAEVIDLGQARQAEIGPAIWNVSVMGGFSQGDVPYQGMNVVITGDDRAAVDALADELAEAAWARRARFVALLTPLDAAVQRAKDSPVPLVFADVADNPGGGSSGKTMWLLRAFLDAFRDAAPGTVIVGIINDSLLAADAHAAGAGATLTARFNRPVDGEEPHAFCEPLTVDAQVVALSNGEVTGRRGIFKGTSIRLGATAALRIGGVTVVVISNRTQCADPVFLEHLGLDIGAARAVVLKSRGHFRGGFDEFFQHEQVVEVDAPGLTSPILTRFDWRHLPRPVLPIDQVADWSLR